MTFLITFSLREYFVLFPRIQISGPALSIVWLGFSVASIQRVAAGIITPEQLPILDEALDLIRREHERKHGSNKR